MNNSSQLIPCDRFHQEGVDTQGTGLFIINLLAKSRTDDNRYPGPDLSDFRGQLHSGHVRHAHIGYDQIKLIGIIPEGLQSIKTVASGCHLVAQTI